MSLIIISQVSSFLCAIRNRSYTITLMPSSFQGANDDQHYAIRASTLENKSALKHTMESHNDMLWKPNASSVEYVNEEETGEPEEYVISEEQRSAKIHDFCFGLPFGAIVFSGGLIGFIFSRNPAFLVNVGLYGGALMALSILSLKIWRQGQSSTAAHHSFLDK